MCLEQGALSQVLQAFGTVANMSQMLVFTAVLLLPTTYFAGLFVLSQAFMPFGKMH